MPPQSAVPAGTRPPTSSSSTYIGAVRRRNEHHAVRIDTADELYNRLDATCRCHAKQRRNQSWDMQFVRVTGRHAKKARPWRILDALLRPKHLRCPALSIAEVRGLSATQLANGFADTFALSPPYSAACHRSLRATATQQGRSSAALLPHARQHRASRSKAFSQTDV